MSSLFAERVFRLLYVLFHTQPFASIQHVSLQRRTQ